jgi:hypothetical protein
MFMVKSNICINIWVEQQRQAFQQGERQECLV